LIYLNEKELKILKKKFKINTSKLEDHKFGQLADKHDISVCYGSYAIKESIISVSIKLITVKGAKPLTFKITGNKYKLKELFSKIIYPVINTLEIAQDNESNAHIQSIPGTDKWGTLKLYTRALNKLRYRPKNIQACSQALPLLNQVLKSEPNHPSARAYRASCQLAVKLARRDKSTKANRFAIVKRDLDNIFSNYPNHPLAHNAMVEYLIATKQYRLGIKRARRYNQIFPANHRQYFLLGHLLRLENQVIEAEVILNQGLKLQGTEYQRKPYYKELGMLLLEHNDHVAEKYLAAAVHLEPTNYKLHYMRANALFRLNRYMEAMKSIDQADRLVKSKLIKDLKSKIATAAASQYYDKIDFDNAFTFATIALNLNNKDFKINLLLSKILRKKGLKHDARQQLELAHSLIKPGKGKQYQLLGNEYIAQGFRLQGAKAYDNYLINNPKAEERIKLRKLIKKLRGNND